MAGGRTFLNSLDMGSTWVRHRFDMVFLFHYFVVLVGAII